MAVSLSHSRDLPKCTLLDLFFDKEVNWVAALKIAGLKEDADLWQPDAAALHGLQDVWGVANPLMLTQWTTLWEATGGRQSHSR